MITPLVIRYVSGVIVVGGDFSFIGLMLIFGFLSTHRQTSDHYPGIQVVF